MNEKSIIHNQMFHPKKLNIINHTLFLLKSSIRLFLCPLFSIISFQRLNKHFLKKVLKLEFLLTYFPLLKLIK